VSWLLEVLLHSGHQSGTARVVLPLTEAGTGIGGAELAQLRECITAHGSGAESTGQEVHGQQEVGGGSGGFHGSGGVEVAFDEAAHVAAEVALMAVCGCAQSTQVKGLSDADRSTDRGFLGWHGRAFVALLPELFGGDVWHGLIRSGFLIELNRE